MESDSELKFNPENSNGGEGGVSRVMRVNVFTKNILRHLKGVLWTATAGLSLAESLPRGTPRARH